MARTGPEKNQTNYDVYPIKDNQIVKLTFKINFGKIYAKYEFERGANG